jgi:hypothetical protein
MKNEPKGKYCNGCVHAVEIPGNCHIGCNNPKAQPERRTWPGCGMWPLNYDPSTVESCDGYSRDKADRIERKEDPLVELARILAG